MAAWSRYLTPIWIAILLSFVGVADAFACKCEKSIKPVKGAKMIFFGKVTKITPRGSSDRVEFDIEQTFQGDEKDAVSLYSNRYGHDCGMHFEVDKTYMVYAGDFYPRGVMTSRCWGTYPTDAPPEGNKWKDHKVEIPKETDLEKDLRKLAKSIVPACGRKHRVRDGGFDLVISSRGDPIQPPRKRKSKDRVEEFRDCVAEKFLKEEKLPKADGATLLQGWYQQSVKTFPVVLDVTRCGDDRVCDDWMAHVEGKLLQLEPEFSDDTVTNNLNQEWGECVEGGIESVGGESHGTESVKKQRDRMLADCATYRGTFHHAEPYLERIDNPVIVDAIKWAAGKKAPEKGSPYPLTKAGGDGFVSAVLKGGRAPEKFRELRAKFVVDSHWSRSPLYLEAFAQAITADDSAPAIMRDAASVALHRAALFVPDAKDAYLELADAASTTKNAKALRAKLEEEHLRLNPPPAAPVDEPAVDPEAPTGDVVEAPPEEQSGDPMLLIVAGVLIGVAFIGIATILKKRG